VIANKVLSMDSGTRMYMTDREDSYQPGTPLGDKADRHRCWAW